MERPDLLHFALQDLVGELSLVERQHYLVDNDSHENDIEHSFAVVMLCWAVHSRYNIPLDLDKIIKYALVHDFPERYAGDTNTFATEQDRADKVDREKESLKRLSQEFADFDEMVSLMNAYEAKEDEEALFVWTIDKMQALILGDMDDWRPYRELGIDYNRFAAKYEELLARSSPHCREIFETLVNYCQSTYYDQPDKPSKQI